MLLEAVDKPIKYRWPEGEIRLEPGKPVSFPDDRALKILQKAPGRVRAVAAPQMIGHGRDCHGSVFAVKIGGSIIDEFWLCLSETEPFDPGDGLPLYRPSEVRALAGKCYRPEDLMAVHRAKVVLDGKIIQ